MTGRHHRVAFSCSIAAAQPAQAARSPPLVMATATAAQENDSALIAELRPRLKVPRSTDMPSADHVGLALRLARDTAIDTSNGFWPKELKSSATRTRIKQLAKRMRDEGQRPRRERR